MIKNEKNGKSKNMKNVEKKTKHDKQNDVWNDGKNEDETML